MRARPANAGAATAAPAVVAAAHPARPCCSARWRWSLAARIVANVQTDWLWFRELGQERVFWTVLGTSGWPQASAGLVTAAFLLVDFWLVERLAPASARLPRAERRTARLRVVLLLVYLTISIAAGLFVARKVVVAAGSRSCSGVHRSDFGVADPLFHRDVSFFVFSLPLPGRWPGGCSSHSC